MIDPTELVQEMSIPLAPRTDDIVSHLRKDLRFVPTPPTSYAEECAGYIRDTSKTWKHAVQRLLDAGNMRLHVRSFLYLPPKDPPRREGRSPEQHLMSMIYASLQQTVCTGSYLGLPLVGYEWSRGGSSGSLVTVGSPAKILAFQQMKMVRALTADLHYYVALRGRFSCTGSDAWNAAFLRCSFSITATEVSRSELLSRFYQLDRGWREEKHATKDECASAFRTRIQHLVPQVTRRDLAESLSRLELPLERPGVELITDALDLPTVVKQRVLEVWFAEPESRFDFLDELEDQFPSALEFGASARMWPEMKKVDWVPDFANLLNEHTARQLLHDAGFDRPEALLPWLATRTLPRQVLDQCFRAVRESASAVEASQPHWEPLLRELYDACGVGWDARW